MKKIYTIFLIGQLLILSFIFNKSIYDLYGLSHIGDTSLNGYKVESIEQETLSRLYNELSEQNAKIQLIKTPISKSDSNQTDYEIYHSDISSVRKFVSVSDNQYTYFNLTKEDFIDSTGIFYTNLTEGQMTEVGEKIGSSISAYTQSSYTSINTMLMANGSELVMLFVMTFGVILIYVIARNKENAVKVLLGYSSRDIVGKRIRETFMLELFSIGAIVIGNMVYYGLQKKLSVFYVLFLMLFLVVVAAINLLLVFLTSMCVKKVNVVDAIKNKRFSNMLDYAVQGTKIVLVLIIVVLVSGIKQDYNALTDVKKQIETYKKLDSFYCSYGYNSDAYEKMETDDALYLQKAEKLKELYQQYNEQVYMMENGVLDLESEEMGETEEELYGMTKEELYESYKQNYIIVNRNYLEKFIDVTISSGEIKSNCPTILVPEKYKKEEQKIREQYKLYFEESYLADTYYGKKEEVTIDAKDLNVVYVEDDYKVELLSDLRYANKTEITIKSPIIMIDDGNFGSTKYMHLFSNCELVFELQNRGELSEMLERAGLENVFAARTMMAPFMEEISNYKFLVEQKQVFLILFVLTLIFLIYISNYIHIYVNSKRYGVKYQMGYSNGRIMVQDIGTTLLLCCIIPILLYLKIDVVSYGLFILLDFEIKKGEMVAITGKSGRGKSTLLNILGLITEKSSGTIYHFEHKNTTPHSKKAMLMRREKIGYLFQNYGLVEEENVEWNLKLALKYKKISRAEKNSRIKEALKRFGMEEYQKTPVYKLSGGEQQRVALARIVLQESQLILADEPTGSLDCDNRDLVVDTLRSMQKENKTILIVTHDPAVAGKCDRVIEL